LRNLFWSFVAIGDIVVSIDYEISVVTPDLVATFEVDPDTTVFDFDDDAIPAVTTFENMVTFLEERIGDGD